MINKFNQQPGRPEQLDISIRRATPDDWEALRKIRLDALSGSDKVYFGSDPDKKLAEEITKSEADYRSLLSQPDRFYILCWKGQDIIGMGFGKHYPDHWWMGQGYVKEKFRGGIGKKIFATRLNEIQQRGGKEVRLGVRVFNARSIHIAESFGFKKVEGSGDQYGYEMMLEDVAAPEVVKKINEALNAG